MHISWLPLAPSLIALFVPLDFLLGKNVRLQTVEGLHGADGSPRGRRWWFVPAFWLDPFRAFFGTYGLMLAFQAAAGAKGFDRHLPWVLVTGLLTAAISVQMLTRRENHACLAPIAFAVGVLAARLPLAVSIPAVVLGVASMLAFRALAAFFVLSTVTIVALGFLHAGGNLGVLSTALVAGWPLILVLILQSILMVAARR